MNNRYLVGTVVVVGAIFVGVTITTFRMHDPLFKRLVTQQAAILDGQRVIQKQLADGGSGDNAAAGSVEQRLAALEKQVAMLSAVLKNVQAPGQGRQAAQARPAPPPEDLTTVYDLEIGHSPIKGKKDAPVTIVEFMDFQCPYCSRFHPVIDEVLEAYPDQVRYVLKNFPLSFHPNARPAAKAAFAAGEQGKYYEMVNLLLDNSRELSEEKFAELAQQLGLNVEQFKADYKNNDAKYEAWIKADMDLAQKVGVRGTPTFYLQGRKTVARDLASYKKEIDKALSEKE